MRKLLSVLLTVLLVFVIIPICDIHVLGAVNSLIDLSSKDLKVGDSLTVTVNIKADEEMYATEGLLDYDASVLEYNSGGSSALVSAGTVKIVGAPGGAKSQSYKIVFVAKSEGNSNITLRDMKYVGENLNSVQGASVSVSVLSDYTATSGIIGDCLWQFNDDSGELVISLANTGTQVLPDNTTDYTAVPWYGYKRNVTSITVGEGIEGIGENVFSQTVNLKTVRLPESLKKIGAGAFSECPNLETINIPSGVTEIRPNTFYNCRKLKNIDLAHILGIGEYAFYRCSSLESVILNNAFYVGKFAFSKNTSLKTVVLGDNISSVNEEAFSCCSLLQLVTLPKTVDYIDETAFDENVILNYNVLGDLNGDGEINAIDLVEMKKGLLLGDDNLLCDVNSDGEVNILDFISLNKQIA